MKFFLKETRKGNKKKIPLYKTSIKIFISPLSMFCLQKVLLIYLNTCVHILHDLWIKIAYVSPLS